MKKQKPKISKKALKEKEYEALKKQYYRIEDDETIKKWKVLSKAYKIGKEIYGHTYSVSTLSIDFDIPYTTAKRVLSLDKANKNTWKLINSKKISAFKAVQVLMTKNTQEQDKFIEKVIQDNLSTYQIKKLKVYGGKDDKIIRLEEAVEKGFSREDAAYRSIIQGINKLSILMDIDIKKLPENKIPDLIDALDTLQIKIKKKVEDLITHKPLERPVDT